jgi:hypothetical protein
MGNLNIAIKDIVLQLQVLKSNHKLLNLATHLGRMPVLKL